MPLNSSTGWGNKRPKPCLCSFFTCSNFPLPSLLQNSMKSQKTYPNRGLPVHPPLFQEHKPRGVAYSLLLTPPLCSLCPETPHRQPGQQRSHQEGVWVRGMGMGKGLSQMIHSLYKPRAFKSQFKDPISVLPL